PESFVMDLLRFRLGYDAILDVADPFDLHPHDVANLQIHRRLLCTADTGRRTGRENITRLQREHCRELLDHLAEAVDEIARVAVLPQLAVHPGLEGQVV